jgi:hypothetical protein
MNIKNEPMSAEFFLDRFSLPRIARLIAPSRGTHDESKVNQSSNPAMAAAAAVAKSKKSVNHGYPINSNQQQQQPTTTSHDSAKYQQHDDIKAANATVAATATAAPADNNNNGELFLLYRHLKKYKVYHAINAKSGTNRKKGIKIPQDFTGELASSDIKCVITLQLLRCMLALT